MAGNNKRTNRSENVVGSKSLDLAYNDRAGAYKMLGPILGKVSILGALNAAVGAERGDLIAVFNNSATVAFVATGTTSGLSAPTGGANGIALAPNSYTIIAMGDDNWIRASAATVFGYKILDDSSYNTST
jgi:hypothetical protein